MQHFLKMPFKVTLNATWSAILEWRSFLSTCADLCKRWCDHFWKLEITPRLEFQNVKRSRPPPEALTTRVSCPRSSYPILNTKNHCETKHANPFNHPLLQNTNLYYVFLSLLSHANCLISMCDFDSFQLDFKPVFYIPGSSCRLGEILRIGETHDSKAIAIADVNTGLSLLQCSVL